MHAIPIMQMVLVLLIAQVEMLRSLLLLKALCTAASPYQQDHLLYLSQPLGLLPLVSAVKRITPQYIQQVLCPARNEPVPAYHLMMKKLAVVWGLAPKHLALKLPNLLLFIGSLPLRQPDGHGHRLKLLIAVQP